MGWKDTGNHNLQGWAGSNGNPGANEHGWHSESGSGGVAGAVGSAVSSAVDTAANIALAEGIDFIFLLIFFTVDLIYCWFHSVKAIFRLAKFNGGGGVFYCVYVEGVVTTVNQ